MRFKKFADRVEYAYNTSLDVLDLLDQNGEFRGEAKLLRRRLGRAYRVLQTDISDATAQERYRTMILTIEYYLNIACED